MSTLKCKSVASKIYYIFDWNRDVFLEQVFCNNTYMYSSNLLRGVMLKLLEGVLKNTERCYGKILRDGLKKVVQGVPQNY